MITHVALFRWKADAPDGTAARVVQALMALPGLVPSIRSYRCGTNIGPEHNFDFGVVAEFDDPAGHRAYADHPEHLRVADTLIRPYVAERVWIQFENPGSTSSS